MLLGGEGNAALQIRAQLETILGNPQFARSKRSARLLRYLVERALEGQAERLKEYTLGLEVLDRDENFDPRIDTVVRVEASRLRARLKAYYEGPGQSDSVRIEIPVGSYVPVFTAVEADEAPPPKGLASWLYRGLLPAIIAVAAGALAVRTTGCGQAHSGTSLVSVRRFTAGDGVTAYPALAPDGRWIVYSSDRGGRDTFHLWKQSLSGGEPIRLTSGTCNHTSATVSPDGAWIAFRSDCGTGGIFLIPSNGGRERLLARFGRDPRFSSRGNWLTYWTVDPVTGFGKLYVTNPGIEMEPVSVARDFDDAHNPTWTPDGEALVICGTRRTGGDPEEEHDFWVVPKKGGAAAKTRAFSRFAKMGLDAHSGILSSTSFGWSGQDLVFAAASAETVNLWKLPLDRDWHANGDPEPLIAATNHQLHPSLAGSTLAFSSANVTRGVWSIPFDADRARVTGAPRRLTESGRAFSPAVTRDGEAMVFLATSGSRKFSVWQIGANGQEIEVPAIAGNTNRLAVSPDGRTAFYRILEGTGLRKQVIYGTDLQTGATRRLCDDCGAPTDVSPDGHLLVYETPNTLNRLAVLRLASGEKREILEYSHHPLRAGRVSPDGGWIAFQVDRGPDGRQVYVAPFRGAADIPESSWIPVTPASEFNGEPAWSPNARFL